MSDPQRFSVQYASALQRYLAHREEAALSQAYALGRKALAEQIGLVEMISIHQKVLANRLMFNLNNGPDLCLLKAADEFFRECAGPFEMTLRGFQETLAKLQEMNVVLEKKVAERTNSLRRTAEILRALFEASPLPVIELDSHGDVLMWNPAAENLFGWKQEEILGLPNPIIPADQEKEAALLHRRALRGERFAMLETTRQRKDGSIIPVSFSLAPLYDFAGQPLGVMMVISDITERKRIETELKKAADKYSTLFNTTSDGVWIHNLNAEILEVNDAYCRMSGYSRDELLHMSISKLEASETVEDIAKHIKKVIEIGGHDRFESRHRRKDGVIFDVDITALYFAKDGGRMAIFVRDITERKRMEEELRRSRNELEMRVRERTAKLEESEARLKALASDLINAQEVERKRIAHELHDSLAAQLAAIKYRVAHRLHHGDSAGNPITLEDTIRDIESAMTEIRRIMANLRPSVLDDLGILPALSWFCRETEKAYPGIVMEHSTDIEEQEVPDALKIVLFRVVQESVTNAVRHGKSKRIQIRLEKKSPWIRLKVDDDGNGFESVKFEEKTENSGIGLDSMQQRVDSTGGIFSITSTPGQGTTVKAEWKTA